MIALAVVAALLAPHGIQSEPPALTTEQAQAKYSAQCRGKNTEECKNLRWQVEYALYEDLRFAARLNQPIDADTQHVGATADCPQLKTFVLHLWRGGGMPKTDQPAVIAALNDPYPRVREAAFELVGQLDDPRYTKWSERRKEHYGYKLPMVDPQPPDEATLSGPVYTGAAFQYFASDDKQAFFATPDSSDKVVAFYKKAGKKVLTTADLKKMADEGKKKQNAAQQDPMAFARAMQAAMAAGKDPQQAMQEMQGGMMAGETSANLARDWSGKEAQGISNPRFVVLEEKGGAVAQSAVVYEDKILGATAIVFPNLADKKGAELINAQMKAAQTKKGGEDYQKEQMRKIKVQQIMNDTFAQPGGGND